MQYSSWSVSVSNGSNVVTGATGTLFLSKIKAGQSFKVKGDLVIYTVSSVVSDNEFHLSVPFAGATNEVAQYQVTTDYTVNFGLSEVNPGDQDWATHLTQGMIRKVDAALSLVSTGKIWKGTWDAATNTPVIPVAAVGNTGWAYEVVVPGSTSIGGISSWLPRDTLVSNGTSWFRVPSSDIVAADAAASATSSALSASTSASTATTQAGIATTKAGEAAASEIIATTQAGITTADRIQTGLDVTATNADAVATAADRVQTGLDKAATGLDVEETNADVILTHADVAITNLDAATTAADRAVTGQDRLATAADRIQTGLDSVATGQDRLATTADRVQTGLDKIDTNADVMTTNADVILTAADRVQTGLDRAATNADVVTANADAVLANASAETATTQAGIATTKADEAAASAFAAANSASSMTPADSVTSQAFGDAAIVGIALPYAREDHQHGMPATPTTITGNAGTATKLATARTINGVSFDGTADITIEDSTKEPVNPNIQAHIAAITNPHSVTKVQIGLSNVDNTSDANKPVSTAQAASIALKASNLLTGYTSAAGTVIAADTVLQAIQKLDGNVAGKMPLAGTAGAVTFGAVTVSGVITAATPATGDNSTQVATTAFVTNSLSNYLFYGVAWDQVADTYVRTGNLIGQPTGQTLAAALIPIQSLMRRCVVNDDGTVNYYLHPTDSTKKEDGITPSVLTGANGQVMVQIPKFWHRHTFAGNTHQWDVSLVPLAGFSVHYAFLKDGVEVPYRYMGAYEASLTDTSTKLASISGATGYTLEQAYADGKIYTKATRATYRAKAAARGSVWRQVDYDLHSAIQLLCLTEYANFNAQNMIGAGITNVTDWSAYNNYYPITPTGNSNSIGNATGNVGTVSATSAAHIAAGAFMSYRGIENWYGHIWKYVDGINTLDYMSWVSNNRSSFADDTVVGYTSIGVLNAAADGYQNTLTNTSRGFLPASVGAGSSTKIGDYYWRNTGWRVAHSGGNAIDGDVAGGLALFLHYGASVAGQAIGGRLAA